MKLTVHFDEQTGAISVYDEKGQGLLGQGEAEVTSLSVSRAAGGVEVFATDKEGNTSDFSTAGAAKAEAGGGGTAVIGIARMFGYKPGQ